MHDSDWFSGLCPCNDYPCKRAVAAQKRIEAEDDLRGRLCTIYYKHHDKWPQAVFIDDLVKLIKEGKNDGKP